MVHVHGLFSVSFRFKYRAPNVKQARSLFGLLVDPLLGVGFRFFARFS